MLSSTAPSSLVGEVIVLTLETTKLGLKEVMWLLLRALLLARGGA